jgi:hypothetical protein
MLLVMELKQGGNDIKSNECNSTLLDLINTHGKNAPGCTFHCEIAGGLRFF